MMVQRRQDFGFKKKMKRVRDGGQVLPEFLLMSSVSWSGQSCREHSSDDMVELHELSSTLYAVFQEWFDEINS